MQATRHSLLLVSLLSVILLAPIDVAHVSAQSQSGTGTQAPLTGTGTAGPSNTNVQTIVNPLKVDSLTELLQIILAAVVKLGAVILTLALIWTGFKFVAARGNPEAINSAKSALLWTLIGGLILLGATGIQVVIQSTVNAL